MSISSRSRITVGYLQVVLVGTLLSSVLMYVIALSHQQDVFNAWTSLNSPSEIKRIIAADPGQVWVESRDGKYFTADISLYCHDADICWEWEAINNSSEILPQEFSRLSIDICRNLWNPAARTSLLGRTAECIYARDTSRVLGDEGYFALMTSGDVFYWRNVRSPRSMPFFFILFIGVPLIVALMISALYLIFWLVTRKQNTG